MMSRRSGFTLIELLIVVAIIAILAAIAIPNFIEAQVRAKISRAKADMRSIGMAIEAYRVDFTHYPPDPDFLYQTTTPIAYFQLTTPVAYISSLPRDAFPRTSVNGIDNLFYNYHAATALSFTYAIPASNPFRIKWDALGNPVYGSWVLSSAGPNLISNHGEKSLFGREAWFATEPNLPFTGPGAEYDATNGTKSAGDIVRIGP